MNINEYVQAAKHTNKVTLDAYPETAIHHQMLGLIGEVGELAEKFKKFERDESKLKNLVDPIYDYQEQRQLIKKEFGDIFWYVCVLADMLEFDVNDILQTNIDKLNKRYNENKIQGSGDER